MSGGDARNPPSNETKIAEQEKVDKVKNQNLEDKIIDIFIQTTPKNTVGRIAAIHEVEVQKPKPAVKPTVITPYIPYSSFVATTQNNNSAYAFTLVSYSFSNSVPEQSQEYSIKPYRITIAMQPYPNRPQLQLNEQRYDDKTNNHNKIKIINQTKVTYRSNKIKVEGKTLRREKKTVEEEKYQSSQVNPVYKFNLVESSIIFEDRPQSYKKIEKEKIDVQTFHREPLGKSSYNKRKTTQPEFASYEIEKPKRSASLRVDKTKDHEENRKPTDVYVQESAYKLTYANDNFQKAKKRAKNRARTQVSANNQYQNSEIPSEKYTSVNRLFQKYNTEHANDNQERNSQKQRKSISLEQEIEIEDYKPKSRDDTISLQFSEPKPLYSKATKTLEERAETDHIEYVDGLKIVNGTVLVNKTLTKEYLDHLGREDITVDIYDSNHNKTGKKEIFGGTTGYAVLVKALEEAGYEVAVVEKSYEDEKTKENKIGYIVEIKGKDKDKNKGIVALIDGVEGKNYDLEKVVLEGSKLLSIIGDHSKGHIIWDENKVKVIECGPDHAYSANIRVSEDTYLGDLVKDFEKEYNNKGTKYVKNAKLEVSINGKKIKNPKKANYTIAKGSEVQMAYIGEAAEQKPNNKA